uniref:Interleukin-1 n=1 Tax=Chelonoidis abingdonii TaxID=106734 RepID=A0A8C0GJT1_CHEAB
MSPCSVYKWLRVPAEPGAGAARYAECWAIADPKGAQPSGGDPAWPPGPALEPALQGLFPGSTPRGLSRAEQQGRGLPVAHWVKGGSVTWLEKPPLPSTSCRQLMGALRPGSSCVGQPGLAEPCRCKKLSVVPNRFVQGKQNPIILGVQEGKSCLSCGTSAEPKLQLEDKNIMDLFGDQEQAARFTFHNIPEGSTHRFESAAYPGWFLCTSQKSSEPISITNRIGETEITEFYFKRILT